MFSLKPRTRGTYNALFRKHAVRKTYEAIAPWRGDLQFPLTRESRLALWQAGHVRALLESRLGWQVESMPRSLADTLVRTLHPGEWVAVDEVLATMQRRKDPDEVEAIRQCVQVNLAGYTAAHAAIEPGNNELAVLAAGQRGAMLAAGRREYHDGDYACGAYNGPARNRPIELGEVYIIDAQTYHGGYWSDLSRAFLVGDRPSALQQSIFDQQRHHNQEKHHEEVWSREPERPAERVDDPMVLGDDEWADEAEERERDDPRDVVEQRERSAAHDEDRVGDDEPAVRELVDDLPHRWIGFPAVIRTDDEVQEAGIEDEPECAQE